MPVFERGVAVLTLQDRGYLICSATPSEYRALKLYRDGHLFVVSDQVTSISQNQPLRKIKLRNLDLGDGKVACVSGSRDGDRLKLRWRSQLWLADQFDPEVGPNTRPVNGILEEPLWSTTGEVQDYLSAPTSFFSPQLISLVGSNDHYAVTNGKELVEDQKQEITQNSVIEDVNDQENLNIPAGDEKKIENGRNNLADNGNERESKSEPEYEQHHMQKDQILISSNGLKDHQRVPEPSSPQGNASNRVPSPTNRQGRPECSVCGETFYTATGLEKHLARAKCSQGSQARGDTFSPATPQQRPQSAIGSERFYRSLSPARSRDHRERITGSPYGNRPAPYERPTSRRSKARTKRRR